MNLHTDSSSYDTWLKTVTGDVIDQLQLTIFCVCVTEMNINKELKENQTMKISDLLSLS